MKWLLFGDVAKATGRKVVHVFVDRHATVGDALEALVAAQPELEDLVYDGPDLHDDVHVLHNHRSVIDKDGLDTELAVGDELALFRLDVDTMG